MEKIALDKIIVNNPYLRINTDIESLVKSIQTVGLINPLILQFKKILIVNLKSFIQNLML